jgi:hypothetical protein
MMEVASSGQDLSLVDFKLRLASNEMRLPIRIPNKFSFHSTSTVACRVLCRILQRLIVHERTGTCSGSVCQSLAQH